MDATDAADDLTVLADVVRRRRMTRAFDPRPLAPGVIGELVDLASRAPSAGKTQGWHLVVLEGAETSRFWDITLPVLGRGSFPVAAPPGCAR